MTPTITPRPHQSRTLEAIRQSARQGKKKILVVLPTGGGKMLLAAMIMEAAWVKGRPACFFADQRELIGQHERELMRLGVNFGTIMSGTDSKSTSACIQVIAKDTLWARAFRRGRMAAPSADVICMDECHKSLSKTWQAVAEHYKDSFIVGFTATPCRADGRGLGDFYDELIVGATYKELQDAGYLVPCTVYAPDKPDLTGIKVCRGDYAEKPLEERMNQSRLVGNIVEEWKRRAEGRITLCFATGIQHSIHIRNEFRRAGVNAEHIDGKTPTNERDDLLAALNDGRIQVMTNCGVLTTGVDVPIAKCCIMARPTKSFGLFRQIAGRVQRAYPGYSDCLLLDHAGAVDTHNCFPDDDMEWTLEKTEHAKLKEPKDGKDKGPVRTCPKCKAAFRGDWCPKCGTKFAKAPYRCEACGKEYRGPQCPHCGHRPEMAGKGVKMEKGDLQKRQRKELSAASLNDKQGEWDKCLGWAIGTKQKIGAAAHRYRQRFGKWPNNELRFVPRGKSEWNMNARDYYEQHVIPAKEAALATAATQ